MQMQAARAATPLETLTKSTGDEVTGREAATRRALVIDDEAGIVKMLKVVLERQLNMDVSVASNGSEAVDQVAEHQYDLIICDVRMPVMSGAEFFDWLRLRHPAQAAKVFFITGDYGNTNDSRILNERQVPVLKKPFSLTALLSECRGILNKF